MAHLHPGATWRIALFLALAALAAYWNTFSVPFVFDDLPAITENASIRDLRRPGQLVTPNARRGSSAAGRPVVNLSLALSRAISGDAVWSYHAFNLLVHLGAGLALFGVVRRTLVLRRAPCDGRDNKTQDTKIPALTRPPTEIAFAVALLWLLHPLQTESVTCVIQRTESLAGLFFLLTFYAWLRGWRRFALVTCLLGAATKELLAVAPVLLFLFDRTFQAGTFRAAWRERGRWHVALGATTWLAVAFLIWRSEVRGGTVGFGHGIAWWEYALKQFQAVAVYLKLTVWPHPLVLDYGTEVVRDFAAVWPQALLLLTLLALTGWAIARRPAVGFLGAWCFVILAPSSSVVPLVTQTMAEHRMYLPLAAVLTLSVVAWQRVGGRWFWPGVGLAAVAFGALTSARNHDYRSAEAIWQDNLAKLPGSVRAHLNLAQLADAAGRNTEAIAHGEAAIRLRPDDAEIHFNLAFSLEKVDRTDDAIAHYREAIRLRPAYPDPHGNLGAIWIRQGRIDDAIVEFETVTRLRPDSAEDQFNLAQAYAAAGRLPDAIARYEASLRLAPGHAETHRRLGNAWVKRENYAEAERAYRESLRLEPRNFETQVNLAGSLLMLGRPSEAATCYEAALQIKRDPRVAEELAKLRASAR